MENELEIKIDDEFAKKVYDEIWAEYKKTAQTKTFAKITLTEDELKITDSKVMGLPYVPIGKKIPETSDGNEMFLIAQINCENLRGLKDFPKKGILQFFVANDSLMGLDLGQTVQNGFRVIYHEEIGKFYNAEKLKDIYNPQKFEEYGVTEDNQSYKMNFELQTEKERFEDFFEDILDKICEENSLDPAQELKLYEKLQDLVDYSDDYHSQCEGFPYFTQEDPRKYEEKYQKYDTLLFQLDSEHDKTKGKWKVCIGDAGVINFFINREKLKNKDFSEILYNWDCS